MNKRGLYMPYDMAAIVLRLIKLPLGTSVQLAGVIPYPFFGKDLEPASPAVVGIGSEAFEGYDPKHQFLLQSVLNINNLFQIDVVVRVVDSLRASIFTLDRNVPLYGSLNVKLA